MAEVEARVAGAGTVPTLRAGVGDHDVVAEGEDVRNHPRVGETAIRFCGHFADVHAVDLEGDHVVGKTDELVVHHLSGNDHFIGHSDDVVEVHGHQDRCVDVPHAGGVARQVQHVARKPDLHVRRAKRLIGGHGVHRAEGAVGVRDHVGQEDAVKPYFDGGVTDGVVHLAQQHTRDEDRALTVHVAVPADEENLARHADVETHVGLRRQVVLRVRGVTHTDGVDPIATALELDRNLVFTGVGALGEHVGEQEAAVAGGGFHAGHGYAVNQQVNDGQGWRAVDGQGQTKVVEQGAADVEGVASDEADRRFGDGDLRRSEHDETRGRVAAHQSGRAGQSAVFSGQGGLANREVRREGQHVLGHAAGVGHHREGHRNLKRPIGADEGHEDVRVGHRRTGVVLHHQADVHVVAALGSVVERGRTETVEHRIEEEDARGPSAVEGRGAFRAHVKIHARHVGGAEVVRAALEGLPEADRGRPSAADTDGAARDGEAHRLTVNGEEHVGRQHAAVAVLQS